MGEGWLIVGELLGTQQRTIPSASNGFILLRK